MGTSSTSIVITATEATSGKKRKRSFSDINPKATNAQLKEFAQQLNAMTTNIYAETDRIDRINVDSPDAGKKYRNITITGAEKNATATLSAVISQGVAINPAIFYYTGSSTAQILSTSNASSGDPTIANLTFTVPNSSGTIFVGLSENNNFYPDFKIVTVN